MKKRWITLFVFFSLTLFSCGVDKHMPYTDYISFNDTYIEGEGFYRPARFSREYKEVYQDYPFDTYKKINMPAKGTSKILVIPVNFKYTSCEQIDVGCSVSRMQIQNTFFGKNKTVNWESVASFYNKSSFGQLRIEGEVSDWFTTSVSVEDIQNDDLIKNKMNIIAEEASVWYQENYDDYLDYDTDKDGFIDAVTFVYASKSKINTNLWAYVSSLIQQNQPDILKPQFKNYMWLSYDFMNAQHNRSVVDARTFIHETGHLLGLPDYYSSDSKQVFNPTGKMDMMDLGLGDHNTFSKMLLAWNKPYVVTKSTTIRLRTSQLNGECILLANNWNGSAMDEYLLIEYYTPTMLNKYHTTKKFSDGKNSFSLMKKAGVKILHVDARVGYFTTYPQKFIGYEETIDKSLLDHYDEVGQLYSKQIAHSNTLLESCEDKPLLHALESNNQKAFETGGYMTNESLFHENDTLNNFMFNDGERLSYDIKIGQLTKHYVDIIVTAK